MAMNQLFANDQYKVVKVAFNAGEGMTDHCATTDAFIIVQKGRAKIKFKENEVDLTEGSHFSIPANQQHSLEVTEAFAAHIVFGGAGKIEFANPGNN